MKSIPKTLSCSLLALLSLLFTNAAFAENVEWKWKGFDFKQIQNIYIDPSITYYEGTAVDSNNVSQCLEENKKYLKRYKITNNSTLADATIKVSILTWNTREEYVPAYTYITYDTVVHYRDEKGKRQYSRYPEAAMRQGYTKQIKYFTAKYEVFDKEGNLIYEYVDEREANKDTINMFERASKNFFKQFNKTAKK